MPLPYGGAQPRVWVPDDASEMIPILAYIGRIIPLNDESLLAKISEPKTHEIPHMIRVFGAPILLARLPASKLPNGAVPMKAIV